MKKTSSQNRRHRTTRLQQSPTLKELAGYLGLAPATVSTVMNGRPCSGIALNTQERIRDAARKLNYRPNFLARCLRTRRSFTVGVLVPEISQGYNVVVLGGIEEYLLSQGYFYLVASHHFRLDLLQDYSHRLLERSIDGLIVVCAAWRHALQAPVVTVSGNQAIKGTTGIVLDHRAGAELALRHLAELGHRQIAFIKGPPYIPDSEVRWKAIQGAAARLGLPISPRLVAPIIDKAQPPSSPRLGDNVTKRLLASGEPFTAVFAFNDISAMGAINTLGEHGLRVPADVSVIGFDDIESATYQGPRLTTIRQPLVEMGKMAGEAVLRIIATASPKQWSAPPNQIIVEPTLVVRDTTARPREPKAPKRRSTRGFASVRV